MKRRSIYVLAAVILLSLALLPVSAAAAETGVTVEIPVEVHRTGAAMDPCEIFEIVLTPDDAGAPPPDTDTLRCTALEDGPGNAPGGFSFTVTAPGSCRYTVRERCGSCAGMTYDDTVYQLLVTAQYGADEPSANGKWREWVGFQYTTGVGMYWIISNLLSGVQMIALFYLFKHRREKAEAKLVAQQPVKEKKLNYNQI